MLVVALLYINLSVSRTYPIKLHENCAEWNLCSIGCYCHFDGQVKVWYTDGSIHHPRNDKGKSDDSARYGFCFKFICNATL